MKELTEAEKAWDKHVDKCSSREVPNPHAFVEGYNEALSATKSKVERLERQVQNLESLVSPEDRTWAEMNLDY